MKLDGNKVRRLRVKADLTQEQLAELARLNTVTVFNVERGKSVQDLTAQRIATALGVEIDVLEVKETA